VRGAKKEARHQSLNSHCGWRRSGRHLELDAMPERAFGVDDVVIEIGAASNQHRRRAGQLGSRRHRFAHRGREVILFDSAGVGRSPGSVPTTVARMATDAPDFLDELAKLGVM
jgi:pimeloyl-ACP methyl ester carboxylesterase